MPSSTLDFTRPIHDPHGVGLGVHGPVCIPYVPWGWDERRDGPPPANSQPHSPGLYGRYIAIDLDENNRFQIEAWLERHPGREHVPFGWGVCRHGFGLQDFRDGVVMDQQAAEARAKALNDNIDIGNRTEA